MAIQDGIHSEIGGAVFRGGISATIGLRGNPCSRIRGQQSRKGSLLGGVRVMAACMGHLHGPEFAPLPQK